MRSTRAIPSPRRYTATVTDANGATDTQTVTITITGTNDAPVISSEAGRRGDLSRACGRRRHGGDGPATATGTLSASDVDDGETATLVWSITGPTTAMAR